MSRIRPHQSFADHLRHHELDEGIDGARQLSAAEIDKVGFATVDTMLRQDLGELSRAYVG